MKFIADLHVHSKFSRATAKNLDLENLYIAAQLKGITVVGTGDFTHPGWFAEIKEKLISAEEGLFKLKDEIAQTCNPLIPQACRGEVRFILETEISNIYKKNNKTRKNHNLVFLSDIKSAEKFNIKLDKIGNIKSDGRPILGLDAKYLLETLLDVSDRNFLIPAHIWTPWFSVLGSKSGFNSISECFEDLTPHIFSVETGLSSDPAMNWRVSGLDGLTLISNSDAHSPLKLGREANLFNTELSYSAIRSAIETGDPNQFLGTFEFYPEEGKYHLDGHRKCNFRVWPQDTAALKGICPLCGKALTIGVLNRVQELADQPQGRQPEKHHPFYSILPLQEILSELLKVGANSKKVKNNYYNLLQNLGSEFQILNNLSIEMIENSGPPLLGEAIRRMRRREINILPGYDGEFGQIKIFKPDEREKILGQKNLFKIPALEPKQCSEPERNRIHTTKQKNNSKPPIICSELNRVQKEAAEFLNGPLMIVAGPGTGKTHTLTHRIAVLIKDRKISAAKILAVTFTNKAAREMQARLQRLLKDGEALPFTTTFHALCLTILTEQDKNRLAPLIVDDNERKYFLAATIKEAEAKGFTLPFSAPQIMAKIISAKQQLLGPDDRLDGILSSAASAPLAMIYRIYQDLITHQKRCDFEDLIIKVVRLFESDPRMLTFYRKRFKYVFVDEYQDINFGQYRLIRLLCPSDKDLCVIGDPDQSIYGFRGSDFRYFNRFKEDFPQARILFLKKNYRSTQTILDASFQIIQPDYKENEKERLFSDREGIKKIKICKAASEKAEATFIGKNIERLVGGTGFHSVDFKKIDNYTDTPSKSFADIAILFRTLKQIEPFSKVFNKAGIPFQVASKNKLIENKAVSLIISLLKVVGGMGSFFDLETIRSILNPGISRATIQLFNNWCYQNRFAFSEGSARVGRFPISGMGHGRQQRLVDCISSINQIRKKITGMTVALKINYLRDNFLKTAEAKYDCDGEAMQRLFSMSSEFSGGLADFISFLALAADCDVYDAKIEKVSLMTIHAAKGLEFPIVFIAGCENGFHPFYRHADIDEERRLFYVGMTRAQEQLFLSYADKRRIHGKIVKREVSAFVTDIEERLLAHADPGKRKKNRHASKQLQLF